MKRLLDTNVCIDVLRGRKKVVARLAACRPKDCFISVVTEFELFQGADRAPPEHRDDERAKVSRFVTSLQILPFDSECARIAASINARLLNQGTPVSITDVFIAAKQRDLILKIVEEHQLDKADIEALANERFGKGVRILNKVEASGLIDELLDTYGGAKHQGNHGGSTRRNGSAYSGAHGRRDAA